MVSGSGAKESSRWPRWPRTQTSLFRRHSVASRPVFVGLRSSRRCVTRTSRVRVEMLGMCSQRQRLECKRQRGQRISALSRRLTISTRGYGPDNSRVLP